ncbi:MAG: TlpA family protein disulfide reductase [Deltaproteobacteria bacterium]|nr:TlpA family protein disulfide reductase [Deltaproteobacteria bacterium]
MRFFSVVVLAFTLVILPVGVWAKSPDFTEKGINGKWNGKPLGLRSFKGKVVYMTFFATWCKPCITELKQLKKVYEENKKQGLVVLAVSVDEPQTRSRVRPTVKRLKLPFPAVIDAQGTIVRLFNPKRATPFSVLFDRQGKVRKTRSSFQISDLPEIRKEILEALRK